ncbi:MAG: 4-hydroxy-tetrahydrodipicolinate synthase [Flavobacteriales bacterium]|nr:4-hydroxy-tetrahydrodipicolinate synthase [Flavobacteriales bacterium]
MNELKGLGVAMVTPFKKDLTVDIPALKKLTDFLVENGADYLVVMGTTGESVTLDKEDKKQVIETVLATNAGRKPVVLGVGGNNTYELTLQLDRLDTKGIDAILSVSPYYNKPTQNGLFEHYKALSEHSKLPIILYNVPGRTSSNMTPETVLRIAFDCRNVIGIKEASGNMEQIMTIIKEKPKDFMVISGDDAITLPLLACGADGVISVVGNAFPKEFGAMVHHGLKNEMNEARVLHYRLLQIIQHLFVEGNPAGIKEVLAHLDICENYTRLPLVPVSQATSEKLRRLLIDEDFIK